MLALRTALVLALRTALVLLLATALVLLLATALVLLLATALVLMALVLSATSARRRRSGLRPLLRRGEPEPFPVNWSRTAGTGMRHTLQTDFG